MDKVPREPLVILWPRLIRGALWLAAINYGVAVMILVFGAVLHPALAGSQAVASRSSYESAFKLGWRSNLTLFGLAVAVIALQLLVVYTPGVREFFTAVPLTLVELLICVGLGSLAFWAIELEKLVLSRR